ncbi:hypothetical protein HN358_01815 [Candidatus Uhrbacteria bacterium]|jgi:hypothetical protein|nr:hypothetical protein [Candidatus Uhrbacteria bacterium]MBT7716843.1 hypothetical protein [Candidatus Uhrbacteria bacterium]
MSAVVPSSPTSANPGRPTNSCLDIIPQRQWRRLKSHHQRALVHFTDLEDVLPDGTLPSHSIIFNMKTGEQVTAAVATALAERCKIAYSEIERTFMTVARMTTLDPTAMIKMVTATTLREFCLAIPERCHEFCDRGLFTCTGVCRVGLSKLRKVADLQAALHEYCRDN